MLLTRLGKALVFVQLALGVACAAFAAGVYTNRIDWAGTGKGAAAAASGVFGKKLAEFETWGNGTTGVARIAQVRWEKERAALQALEAKRPREQKWYAEKIAALEGVDAAGQPVDAKIEVLAPREEGKPEYEPDGRPRLVGDETLASRREYGTRLAQRHREITDTEDAIKKLLGQEAALTQQIDGVRGKTRGLRDLLQEEQAAQANAVQEFDHLKPLRVNREVQAVMLLQRNETLQNRLKELSDKGVAVRSVLDSPETPGHTPRP